MRQVPELTQQFADEMTKTVFTQLRASRQYKLQRMKQIQESEDLYFGVVPKSVKNPFNESFPFMSGFVDTLVSKLDDPPEVEIVNTDEGDLLAARKYTALFSQFVTSNEPNAMVALKDRWCKKLAIFSGYGVYYIFGDNYNDGKLKMTFGTEDYYDFHSEPNGGGSLENHLFYGTENIFLTKEDLEDGANEEYYDKLQVAELLNFNTTTGTKPAQDEQNIRYNRHKALALDPVTNNYVGQQIYKCIQWFLVYKGIRYYVLAEEQTQKWLRIKPLRDMYPVEKDGEALWPHVAWHTNEEAGLFLSKAPADDARPMGKTINRLFNQELYNREKKNTGHRLYDPELVTDLESLMDWRPDGLTPIDTKGGQIPLDRAVTTMKVGELSGTVDLIAFIDNYTGQKTATTPGSMGEAPKDQKVGIFYGELQQIEGRLGLHNKSFKEAWAGIVYRFIGLVDKFLEKPEEIEMLGVEGLQTAEFTTADKKRTRQFKIKIKGGNDDVQKEQQKKGQKLEALKLTSTAVNPKWKDNEILKTAYSDDEIMHAFDTTPPASQELLSEAKKAANEIAAGRSPKLNNSATTEYMQKLVDEALKVDDKRVQDRIYDFALAHGKIAAQNEARAAFLNKQRMAKAAAEMAASTIPGMMPTNGEAPITSAPTVTPGSTV